MDQGWLEHPVFIVGHPKSGTSLLTAVLDAHPELVVLPEESDLFSAYASHLPIKARKNAAAEIALDYVGSVHLRNLLRGQVDEYIGGAFDYRGFDRTTFLAALRGLDPDMNINARGLLREVVKAYHEASSTALGSHEPRAWVEKTAMHTWELDRILSAFPEARFIAVIRDPRDNYVSFRKKRGQVSPYAFAAGWNDAIAGILALGGPPRALILRYEDLVQRSEASLHTLCEFLSIKDAPQLRRPSKFGQPWEGNSMFGDKAQGFGAKALGRFWDYPAQHEVSLVERLTRAGLIYFGYTEHYGGKLSLLDRAQAEGAKQLRLAGRSLKYAFMPHWRAWQARSEQ